MQTLEPLATARRLARALMPTARPNPPAAIHWQPSFSGGWPYRS
jgi:hypothetical protein